MKKQEEFTANIESLYEAYNILEEYACELVGDNVEDNETISYANSLMEQAEKLDDNGAKVCGIIEAYGVIEEYVSELVGSDRENNEILTYTNSIVQIVLNTSECLK